MAKHGGVARQISLWVAVALVPTLIWAETRPRPRPDPAPVQKTTAEPAIPSAPAKAGPAKPARDPRKGAVTGLPIPRYVTLKGGEGNARRGPGLTHRIDWVFTTAGTPLRVTAEYDTWRRVEDFEGMGGWIHFTLLSGVRGIIVTKDMAEFHVLPDTASPVAFQAEAGALAKIMTCSLDWCRVKVDGEKGWALKSDFWGVDPDEVIE
jgi:SH3-like domain-containing protein